MSINDNYMTILGLMIICFILIFVINFLIVFDLCKLKKEVIIIEKLIMEKK